MSEKYTKLKYTPTGNVFTLPEAEAKRIYLEDKGFNYEIVGGQNIELPDETIEESTVYDEVVQDGTTEGTQGSNPPADGEKTDGEKTLEELTVPELKAKLDAMNIKYAKSAKKADLLALFKDSGDGTTEGTQGE